MSIIYFDTETTGFDPYVDKITLVQVKQGSKIRLIKTLNTEKINELKTLLENKDNLVVGHNLKFDLKFLKHHYGIEPINLFDTYIAEILISGGLKARTRGAVTLEALAKQYLGVELNKDEDIRTSFTGGGLTQGQKQYAAMDVAVLPEIHKRQEQQIKELGLQNVFNTEMRCIPATVWLELSGIPIDLEGLKKLETETKEKLKAAEQEVKTILKESGYDNAKINLNSLKQLNAALKDIGVNVDSTGDEIISALDHPVGKAIREYRKLQKLLTGFIQKYPEHINKVTGRIQAEFNQYGTNTGRFTCNKPNVQQVPKDNRIRSLFRCGNVSRIITADYSQIELRIIAEVSLEPKFIEIYRNGGDLHRLTAALLLNKSAAEVTKEERRQAKPVNFGFAYGLGVKSFREKAKRDYGLEISEEKAQEFRGTFFTNYPVLSQYLKSAALEAANNYQIVNRAGRIVKFQPGLEIWQYENMGRNTPIQSLSADITKIAMGQLYHKLKPFNAKLIGAVHDELIFEVPKEHVAAAQAIIKEEMEAAGAAYLKSVPCLVDISEGEAWQK